MESINSRNKKTKTSIPLSSPIKTLDPAVAADQIATPEKPIQLLPRRTRNRSVAFSVKEVKQVAQKLLTSTNPVRSDPTRLGDDQLASIEVAKPSRAKTSVRLPEKYEILAEFFNSMESSIRLLKLKGLSPTFPNICASIQNLTGRRFTYRHLAQLKYIMREVIMIKKVLLQDEATSCMKPDLHITLQVDALEDTVKGKGESGYTVLRRVFRGRLVDFSKEHAEGNDIPEDELPYPFNQTKPTTTSKESSYSTSHSPIVSSSSSALSSDLPQHKFAMPSHMSQSFKRWFSQKIPITDAQKTFLASYDNASSKDVSLASAVQSPIKSIPKPPLIRKSLLGCPVISPSSHTLETPEDEAEKSMKSDSRSLKELDSLEGTPAKILSTPVRLMTATPAIQTPKRCRPLVDDGMLPEKSSKRTARKSMLFTTPKKNAIKEDENEVASSSASDDILSFLPASLLQSVREKETKAIEEKDAGVAEAKRRQKLIACLPSTFDMILLMFQSGGRSILTRQELMHKIIANNCKIVDKGEVEEQLKLLLELIPDWISEKTASSGDILYCVNKLSDSKELRQRLIEAE